MISNNSEDFKIWRKKIVINFSKSAKIWVKRVSLWTEFNLFLFASLLNINALWTSFCFLNKLIKYYSNYSFVSIWNEWVNIFLMKIISIEFTNKNVISNELVQNNECNLQFNELELHLSITLLLKSKNIWLALNYKKW